MQVSRFFKLLSDSSVEIWRKHAYALQSRSCVLALDYFVHPATLGAAALRTTVLRTEQLHAVWRRPAPRPRPAYASRASRLKLRFSVKDCLMIGPYLLSERLLIISTADGRVVCWDLK